MQKAHGHCLCGAVKFVAETVETHHHACHCGMCRRWAGGPLMGAAAHGVVFEGTEHLARYDSSEWAQRGFCRICGSHLFYYLRPADQYILCVGAFSDPAQFTLTQEIYIDRKPPGYAFAAGLTQLTEAEVLAAFGAS